MNELIMLSAYLNKRVMYYRKKQGENTYHQDTIEELETVLAMVDAALDADDEELESINRVLNRIASLGEPLTEDEFSAKLNE
ncbi:hypothetical protein [Veillonella parvula]|uniref:hypothetical protein n=1 Tax=Veillonella parvula TaxID=29466 RepID=UPI00195FC4C9|nr:hypothetical protein [Veillonella parvula]VTY45658.1 Uncharacterised protein [Veillonella parvula]